jgi:hypothetical protein
MSTGTDCLEMLGVLVVRVAGLPRDGIYVKGFGIALIDADVTGPDLASVADELLALAIADQIPSLCA